MSAFQIICNSIAHAFKLTIPLKGDTMSIVTDASGKAFYRLAGKESGRQQPSSAS